MRIGQLATPIVLSLFIAARAYSVLAHESNIDAAWEREIRPLLVRTFPRATADQLQDARAFSSGGSVIQDLGYYPLPHAMTSFPMAVGEGL